jgi:hypothetical protein
VQKWETNFPKSQALFSSTVAFFVRVCCSRDVPGPDSHVNVGLFSFLIRFSSSRCQIFLSLASIKLLFLACLERAAVTWQPKFVPFRLLTFPLAAPDWEQTHEVIRIIRPKSYRQKQSRLLFNEQLATNWTRVQCKHFVIDYFSLIVHSPSSFAILLRKSSTLSTGKRWARNLHVRNTNRASRCQRESDAIHLRAVHRYEKGDS